jgi:hypothetical protein
MKAFFNPRQLLVCFAVVTFGFGATLAQAQAASFSATLTAEQRKAAGLDKLSPEELAALDRAVAAYRQSAETTAAKTAAATAVAEYKKHEEPGIVARALASFKRQQAEEKQERINAHIVGDFHGWEGRTLFNLDNGQVWQQATADEYYISPQKNPAVVVFKTTYGGYRLELQDGAWVNVKRLR